MIRKVSDSNAEYHSSPLLGTSTIVSGYDSKTGEINLAKVKAYLDEINQVSNSLQKIFDYGTVQHSAVLEQDLSKVVVLPDFEPIPGKTGKAQAEEWEKDLAKRVKSGVVSPDQMATPKFKPIAGITKASQVEKFKRENPADYYINGNEFKSISGAFDVISGNASAARMISNALDVEASFYDDVEGIKTRPDLVGETDNGGLYVCNYKTIADLGKCHSHIYSLKYDIRACQEIDIVQRHYGRNVDHYFFLFQEKKAPYSLKCIELSSIDLDIAMGEYKRCLNTVRISVAEDYFPQPEFKIEQSKVYRAPEMVEF